jgi:hypothetical protein
MMGLFLLRGLKINIAMQAPYCDLSKEEACRLSNDFLG